MTTIITRKQFAAMYPDLPRKFWPLGLLQKYVELFPQIDQVAPADTSPSQVSPKEEKLWALALADKLAFYKRIPPKLRLREGDHLQPPRCVYGWLIAQQDLINFLKSHKLPMASEADMRREYFALNLTIVTKGIHDVLSRECPDASGVYVSLEAVLRGTEPPKTSFCIAIADAYETGNRLPKAEHIQTIATFFGFPVDGVRWYLDSLRDRWLWEDAADYRSWKALM